MVVKEEAEVLLLVITCFMREGKPDGKVEFKFVCTCVCLYTRKGRLFSELSP